MRLQSANDVMRAKMILKGQNKITEFKLRSSHKQLIQFVLELGHQITT